jgi:nicotinate phosphoribosyltransferase
MKVARSAVIAGCAGTSNVAAAMRYGLTPVGTMAHSYVLSFRSELEAFQAFLREHPDNGVLLVDTYEVEQGVRNAIDATRAAGVPLRGVRIDSGKLDPLARQTRQLLDEAGMTEAEIIVSGDLEELKIAELVAAGAPIDRFGVGTDLGTSRDSPTVNGIYKLVADADPNGEWRGVRKLSQGKATLPGPKQVYRRIEEGQFAGDLIAATDESVEGEPLLVAAMREGEIALVESLEQIRKRVVTSLAALPEPLRQPKRARGSAAYPVSFSKRLKARA